MERQPNTQYILSLSYGKDSLACLEAVKQLGYPLDRIVHAEIWATDTIHADLPPMVEFKTKADEIIREWYGYEVERYCASRNGEKITYEKMFYYIPKRKQRTSETVQSGDSPANATAIARNSSYTPCPSAINGFPMRGCPWCNSSLKRAALRVFNVARGNGAAVPSKPLLFDSSLAQEAKTNIVQYLGIAADEPERINRHLARKGIVLPLVDIGWDEAYCRKWCEENELLSPIYTTATRGGCWFCHNQSIDQLRYLRASYPDLWKLLLKWDSDSPVTFRPDGHTVYDFDRRFFAEDLGLVPRDRKFRWKKLAVAFDEYLNGLLGGD